jgi:hypothetical protein
MSTEFEVSAAKRDEVTSRPMLSDKGTLRPRGERVVQFGHGKGWSYKAMDWRAAKAPQVGQA